MNRFERFLFRRVEVWAAIALGALAAALIAIWAVWAYTSNAFPFSIYNRVSAFIAAEGEIRATTVFDKLFNDFGDKPLRYTYDRIPTAFLDGATPVAAPDGTFLPSRAAATARLTEGAAFDDLVLLFGVFEMTEARSGAILIDPKDNRVVRTWPLPPEDTAPQLHKSGFDPRSGLVFFTLADRTMNAVDYCGGERYRVPSFAHHSIEPTGDGAIWHFDRLYLIKREIETGRELRRISMLDVLMANPERRFLTTNLPQHGWDFPDVEKWGMFRDQGLTTTRTSQGTLVHDPFHLNDIQESPPGFFADGRTRIAISARRLNAVFTIDVETLKIDHVLLDETSRQHDTDFHADGTITIFDNNNHLGPVRIISWEPVSGAVETLWDGAALNVVNNAHGNVTRLGEDDWMVLDFMGRLIVTEADEPVYIFENTYDETSALELRNAWPLARGDFERLEAACG